MILQNELWYNEARKNQQGYLNVVKEALLTILPQGILWKLNKGITDQIGTNINVITHNVQCMVSTRCFYARWYFNFKRNFRKEES